MRRRLHMLAALAYGDQTLSVRPNVYARHIPESGTGGDPHTTTSGGSHTVPGTGVRTLSSHRAHTRIDEYCQLDLGMCAYLVVR